MLLLLEAFDPADHVDWRRGQLFAVQELRKHAQVAACERVIVDLNGKEVRPTDQQAFP